MAISFYNDVEKKDMDSTMSIVSWEFDGHKNFIDLKDVSSIFSDNGKTIIVYKSGELAVLQIEDFDGARKLEKLFFDAKMESQRDRKVHNIHDAQLDSAIPMNKLGALAVQGLRQFEIRTFRDLFKVGKRDLKRAHHFGKQALQQVTDVVNEAGLSEFWY